MLDEVRSLLQKSLRRKESGLVLQAAKELLGHGKDQLPWKCLVTFLFEDHCLADTHVLKAMYKAYKDNVVAAKYGCVELLLGSKTCRMAACMPVVALDPLYEPTWWDNDMRVEESLVGLTTSEEGQLNTDKLLQQLVTEWKKRNTASLISLLKLATMVVDNEKRRVTSKGKEFLIDTCKMNAHFGLVVLSALYKSTEDPSMKEYLAACYSFATIPDVTVRLILYAPLARLMFGPSKDLDMLCDTEWEDVKTLTHMPDWAVDKHTFRGKFGSSTAKILTARPEGMTESQFAEFHGPRNKRDLKSFFEEGVQCCQEALENDPFWGRTKDIYFLYDKRKQKTQHMTQQYYKHLQGNYPLLFLSVEEEACASDTVLNSKKRKHEQHIGEGIKKKKMTHGPLLQKPVNSNKVYTCADLEEGKVVKGPYRSEDKLHYTMFVHKVMREVIGDLHTLTVESHPPFLNFPLLKGHGATMESTSLSFHDHISQSIIEDAEFITRGSLGIVQMHKLRPEQVPQVPVSLWAHFLYRFALNIGDSGLYNALTDSQLTFFYGIDMEERRGKLKPIQSLLDVMFTKVPRHELGKAILDSVKRDKMELLQLVDRPVGYPQMDLMAQEYGVKYDRLLFIQRIVKVRQMVARL